MVSDKIDLDMCERLSRVPYPQQTPYSEASAPIHIPTQTLNPSNPKLLTPETPSVVSFTVRYNESVPYLIVQMTFAELLDKLKNLRQKTALKLDDNTVQNSKRGAPACSRWR